VNFWKSLSELRRDQLRVLPWLLGKQEKRIAVLLVLAVAASLGFVGVNVAKRFSKTAPAYGGSLREGAVGIPRFVNPLLAVSDVDRDLVALVYEGLTRYNEEGVLVPALADHFDVSPDGLAYTFRLRADARWSDDAPLAADDVMFTIRAAKNPAYHSAVRANWEGVAVEKVDERTVRFRLQKPYAPFLQNTTLGILPAHIWSSIPATEFNLTERNLKPVGAGPYQALTFEKNSAGRITFYKLERNRATARSRPYIKNITFMFYATEADLASGLRAGMIDSASTASAPGAGTANALPNSRLLQIELPRVFAVFFNQNLSKALSDPDVRQALELATDKAGIIRDVLEGQGTAIYSPIPPGTFGAADSPLYQDRMFDLTAAKRLLATAGWKDTDGNGILEKKNKKESIRLAFSIATSNAPNLVHTGKLLQKMWRDTGASVELKVYELGDFEQNVLRPRKYDAVLFGEVVGHDPDPFAFWHSSQRNDPGLNIALYTNTKVDALLEKARATTDPEVRRARYEDFQKELKADTPAVFLYSPLYIYAIPTTLHGVSTRAVSLPNDRFNSIEQWYIKTRRVWSIAGK